jgi:hypothetical protein
VHVHSTVAELELELHAVEDCARFCRHCGGVLVGRASWCADCAADKFVFRGSHT